MTVSGPDFRQTWLWRQAFLNPRSDCATGEQEFFREQYLSIRERGAQLVSRIAADLPDMTVHDISHMDALWDTASAVAEGAINVNPAESFVLGTSIILHDAAMSLSAYPGGLTEIKTTVAWHDAIARVALSAEESSGDYIDLEDPPDAVVQQILPDVLRRLHAKHAEMLAEQAWLSPGGDKVYLIENSDLRKFYGPTIGQIAHSHWWSVHKVEEELSEDLGALANRTRNLVDRVKLACLLRVADALHLDSRRAPRFLRAVTKPSGVSSLHWDFQERLARPHIELDAVVFTTGRPFERSEAEAWWLAYDNLNGADRELRDVDLLLQSRGREVLKARRVKGAGSPEILSRTVRTRGWWPVDARLQASDVPRIVENLGGLRLYGNDPTVALRELIQNAADAVQARRKLQQRPTDWGQIIVDLPKRGENFWLVVEDNGIGMSEQVLTGPLLDFGTSFWRSPMAMEEFPGLMASGMHAIGRFGIGFFAVFMLGPVVRVYSRRCDKGQDTGRLLEFRSGTSARPILSSEDTGGAPIDGGTRVEVLLKNDPRQPGGLLSTGPYSKNAISLSTVVGTVAPNLDVALATREEDAIQPITQPGDWLQLNEIELVRRLNPFLALPESDARRAGRGLMQLISGTDGTVFGRAFISPSKYRFLAGDGVGDDRWTTAQVGWTMFGEFCLVKPSLPLGTQPSLSPPKEALAQWASKQAQVICDSVPDEEYQARSAEVVLECGGDIGALKIIKWGSDWLNAEEFEERLRSSEELVLGFESKFDYDENRDEVHPREFRDDFDQSDDAAVVLQHDGSMLRARNLTWPNALAGQAKLGESKVLEFVRDRIARMWGADLGEDQEERVVGKVGDTKITREMTIFCPPPVLGTL